MNANRTKTFSFDFSGSVALDVSDIWPDGDAPENPTAADVAKVIGQNGGLHNVIREWGLEESVELDIVGNDTHVTVRR